MLKPSAYLSDRRVVDLKSTTKIDALEELIESIGKDDVADRNLFFRAVVSREKVMTTGVGDGIAIPHARIPQVKNPFLAIGRSAKGIEYGSVDGKPVQIVILIGASDKQTSLYLQLLSRSLFLFTEEPLRKKILKASGAKDVIRILGEAESESSAASRKS